MARIHLLLPLLLLPLHPAKAQLVTWGNSIPVVEGADTLTAAWAGGVNVPQFCEMDLDNDGTDDLLIYERQDDRLLPMRYVSPGRFAFAPSFAALFPQHLLSDWIFTADYNGDGYRDLFTGFQSSTIRALRNTSASSGGTLSFAQVAFPLRTDIYPPGGATSGIYAARNDYSGFADVDGDGDLDVLAFETSGSYLNWHRNVSVESGWGLDSLRFVQQSACFGHFREDVSGCTANIDEPPCITGIAGASGEESQRGAVHAGSTILAWNLNGDTLMDVIIGDASCDHLYALTNGGSRDTAHFTGLEVDFPVLDVPVDLYSFPAAFAVDVDHDNDRDLVVAPNVVSSGEDISSVWMYRNDGTDEAPVLHYQQDDFAQGDMLDFGSGAVPALMDWDQDGDDDLVVGNLSQFVAVDDNFSSLRLYLNEGTNTAPVLVLHREDWLGFLARKLEGLSPCAGDLDGDGDDDLLLGTEDGTVIHLRNDALPGDTARMVVTDSTYQSLDAGLYSAPHLFDLDSDGDLDLLMGNHRGFVQYHRNTGNSALAIFTHVTDSLGGIKLNDASGFPFTNGYSRPWVANLDGDAQQELMVGGYTGHVLVFDNATDAPGAKFASLGMLGDSLDAGLYAAPLAGYPDGTGQLKFLVGNYRGGLMLAEGGKPIHAQDANAPLAFALAPNPTTGLVRITCAHPAEVQLLDMAGRVLASRAISPGTQEWDLSPMPAGLYLLHISSGSQAGTQRLALVR